MVLVVLNIDGIAVEDTSNIVNDKGVFFCSSNTVNIDRLFRDSYL